MPNSFDSACYSLKAILIYIFLNYFQYFASSAEKTLLLKKCVKKKKNKHPCNFEV